MRILVAGATGALGRQLVPRLVAAGHEVAGTTRTPAKADELRRMAATPFALDALDAEQVASAVARFEPEVIVHELTDLKAVDMRDFERSFAMTNRLRTEGTDHLLAAGRAVGVRRFIAQSYAAWPYARTGGPVKTEDDPLDPTPPAPMRAALDAIRHLERATLEADWTEGIVLRYGAFFGPGTGLDDGGAQLELIRTRRFPVVGSGAGVWSFVHIEDAADATVAAIDRGRRGVYNVVDDDPAPVGEWLPAVAERIGAKPPMRVPRLVGRLLAGEAATVLLTEIRGASNAKAKRELGWRPRRSWRRDLGRAVSETPARGDAGRKAAA
ncbi:MAG TPA: NAD(P)-dependent oxidoreductase [Clostridia bacterium]|nr:NAD(P)-dependent oxidoreductase [Clostridia bacterium]